MSDLFPNRYVEEDMTRKFICILYIRGERIDDIRQNGMNPFDIWNTMDYNAYLEPVIPIILNRLINNGVRQDLLRFDNCTNRVILTENGLRWCENINCRRIPGVFD